MPIRSAPHRAVAALAAAVLVSCGGGGGLTFTQADATYTLTLRYLSDLVTLPQSQRDAFETAAARLRAIVTAGLVPVAVSGISCGSGADAVPIHETIHGLVILVSVADLGATGILAESGPCIVRSRSRLPLVAVMRFNSRYIDTYEANGQLSDIVLHEMFHTLGFGTSWSDVTPPRLGGTSTDPQFTGPQALSAAKTYNDGPGSWTTLPVEDLGGSGTRGSHWRESVFHTELMTGFIDSVNPLSETTIASLADLGYHVDLSQADSAPQYKIPAPPPPGVQALLEPTGVFLGEDVLQEPPAEVDEEPGAVP